MRKTTNERSFKDPVCGMEVSYITAIDECTYKGKTYYFCARSCKEVFETEPEKYIHQHRQHGFNSKNVRA